jgi:anti-sigma B factor antagonist
MDFNYKEELEGKVIVIEIPKQLSAEISDEFKDFLYDLVEKGKFKIVVDLARTDYVDSSGLGAIVSRISVCRSNEGDIRLAAPSEFMESLLNITHLDKVLQTFNDVNTAVESFQ